MTPPPELERDIAGARARVRAKARELLTPILEILEVRPERAKAFDVVLDMLERGELAGVDLEMLRSQWLVAWARYREDEQRCAGCDAVRRPPRGFHCVPCQAYGLCDECYQAHAGHGV